MGEVKGVKQIVDIQDSIFQQAGSVQSTAENVVGTGSDSNFLILLISLMLLL